ncbi:MAG: 2-succinyl-6-hydroxy-2,4-cyclohexadiene-1-carboxylate synthase [Phototrophicales bacterium]|nr:MAG: 2-succinyl-6-hydroxy-2,4-cyclohexadiene-1-carboxylate synthase [Phototrophicales bacterium]
MTIQTTIITLNDVAYAIHQMGMGDPMLILHGFTGSGRAFIQHLSPLSDTYQLIAPDLLGHGQSASPSDPMRYEMPHAITDLKALLDNLHIDTCYLLGYSMGGRLALGFALTHPERVSALILESSSAGLAHASERTARIDSDEALAKRIIVGGIEAFVDEWEKLPLWASQAPHIRQALRLQRLNNNPIGLANSLRGMGTGAQPYWGDRVSSLTMPVLYLTGALDDKFTSIASQMIRHTPRGMHITIAGVGHAVHLEAPGGYIHAIRAFLQQVQ